MPHQLKQITLLYALGLLAGRLSGATGSLSYLILSILLLLLLFTFFFNKKIFLLSVTVLFFPLGLLLHSGHGDLLHHPDNIANYADGPSKTIEGRVLERRDGDGKRRFVIEGERLLEGASSSPIRGRVLLTVESGAYDIIPGERVRFTGKLKRPRNFGNPGGFDYERFLRDRGIYATSFISSDRYMAVMGDGNALLDAVFRYRKAVERTIGEVSSGDTEGVIRAITTGDRSGIGDDTLRSFRKSGVAHILAISGLHMGIVAFFFFKMIRWLLARSESLLLSNLAAKYAAAITAVPLTLYLVASGMATSAVRAYIMVIVFLLSVIIERESEIFNTISLAALVILAIWPEALFDAGFQLSFAAVIAIVIIVPRAEKMLFGDEAEDHAKWKRKTATFIIVSIAAALGTSPLTARYFMEVSLIGVISNLIIVPLVGFIAVPLSSMALFISAIYLPASKGLLLLASYVVSVSVEVANRLANIPFASVLTSPPELHEMALYYSLLLFLCNAGKKWVLSAAVIIPLFFISSRSLEMMSGRAEKNLEVTFLSVGQGESAFVRFPGGKTMLIDGGGFYDNSFDVGKMVLRPYLLSQGVRRIDYMVMTHPHSDHMNGLIHIVEEFDTGEVWTNGWAADDENYTIFRNMVLSKGIEEKIITDGSPDIMIGGVKVEFINPEPEFSSGSDPDSEANNGSIVIRLIYSERTFLFTADLEREGEERIVKAGYDISADVIKVPHHGSLTSSSPAFIEKVSPRHAVFTVGYDNRFRFPKDEIVRRYEGVASKIYRTDMDGAITFATDGKGLALSTFRGKGKRLF